MMTRDLIIKCCVLMIISFFILSACSSNDTQRVLTSKNSPNKPDIQAQPLPTPSLENERDVLIVSANEGIYINKDGSQMRAILDSTNDVSIGGWSPDGEKIIYTEYSNRENMIEGEPVSPSYSIKTVNINSGEIVQLVQDGQDDVSTPAAPSYSLDGSIIAFQGILGGAFNIFTISPDGKNLKRITKNDSWQFNGLYWNPDGINLMVFVSPLEKDVGDSFLGLIDMNGNLIRHYDNVNGYVTSWRKIP